MLAILAQERKEMNAMRRNELRLSRIRVHAGLSASFLQPCLMLAHIERSLLVRRRKDSSLWKGGIASMVSGNKARSVYR